MGWGRDGGGQSCNALQAVLRRLEVSKQNLQATEKTIFSLPISWLLFVYIFCIIRHFQFRGSNAEAFSSPHCFPGGLFGRAMNSRTGLLSPDPPLLHFHARVANGIFI